MPLQIIRQDITKMQVDAIVNTTNEEMVGYSGVDLAIHTAAGQGLDDECKTLAPLGLGQAKISGGYNLPAKYVIHTSGPIWRGGNYGEEKILRSCYVESLKLAVENGCESVAFPLISSGVYQYPKDQVLKFAIQVITEFLFNYELTVYICVYDKTSYTFSRKLFKDIKDFIGDDYEREQNYKRFRLSISKNRAPIVEDKEDCFFGLYDEESDSCTLEENEEIEEGSHDEPAKAPLYEICCSPTANTQEGSTLEDYLKKKDVCFRERLFELIDASGMSDVECYKKANVDKRTFSKIKSNKDYRPSKQTVIAFAISLHLDFDTTQALLATVGFTLSQNLVFDKIIRYFIQNGNYDIFEINEALFEFDQTLLGSF
ncbi:MAG: macro domain-containing protein [Clostridia bacterium]|nr:macro domain-containing protein [Clostridia bacterium]